jgi:hypothetical protein
MIGCAAKLPYSGPLCAGSDCVVLGRSVLLPATGGGTSTPSALAMADDCRPHVIHTDVGRDPLVAQYVGWMNGGWAPEDITSPAISTAIVVDPSSQVPTVMVDRFDPVGQPGIFEPWQRQAGGWTNLGAVDGTALTLGDFARGPDGTLHVLRPPLPDYSLVEHGTSATGTAWAFQAVPAEPGSNAQIALAPGGAPQFTFNGVPVGDGSGLTWAALAQAGEEIAPATVGANNSRFVVTGTADDPQAAVPHVVFDATVGPPTVSSVWYASRDGGAWHATPIATTAAGRTCSGASAAGLLCDYDYEQFLALAIVGTSDGQVRLLYQRRRYAGTATSRCDGGPPGMPFCYYTTPGMADDVVEAQLWIAWPEPDGSVGAAPLLDQFDAGMSFPLDHQQHAAIDSLGRIHLVADMSDGSLAYFLIGPSPPTP